jgi:hypothetical protein
MVSAPSPLTRPKNRAALTPVVYVYELDPATSSYVVTGIHHKRLKLEVPFLLDINLTRLGQRGSA